MALFRKRKNTGDQVQAADETGEAAAATEATHPGEASGATPPEPSADDDSHLEGLPAIGTGRGPWDIASAPETDGYLPLGSLWLPAVEGMMLTFEMDEETGEVTAVQVMNGESMLQLQAFAAPRTSGIWSEIRGEIAEGIRSGGGEVREDRGPFGTELLVEVGGNVMRFIGADGPRWFLRGVVNGPAATQPEGVDLMREFMAHVVVDRGNDPMGPRELLALTFPQDGALTDVEAPEGSARYDIDPFERGPEITEIN